MQTTASTVASNAKKAQAAAVVVKTIAPGLAQYINPLIGLIGAVGTLSAGVAAFCANRKKKAAVVAREEAETAAEKAAAERDTVIKGADSLPGAGAAIVAQALKEGTADGVEAAYRALAIPSKKAA